MLENNYLPWEIALFFMLSHYPRYLGTYLTSRLGRYYDDDFFAYPLPYANAKSAALRPLS